MSSDIDVSVQTFEELAPLRRSGVDALRANGWETGFRKLLADLYPDRAHFIYELLQNAEDAGAETVEFELRRDGLHVRHDGARLFTVADITAITGIGSSTKADDATRIGKFGVGFKAVFAYTQRPVIRSGEHAFALVDLFVPTRVEADAGHQGTSFWLPFDRPDKPPERAVAEVARALEDITRSTLLFLTSIQTIACSFPDREDRLLDREELGDDVIAIDSVHEVAGPEYWYRLTGEVSVDGAAFPVAIAFALVAAEGDSGVDARDAAEPREDPAQDGRGSRARFVVQPVDGQVFIYFPAVKETSGLKFHVHAPFASTVARDSVREDEGNDELVAGIARLVAASLPALRDAGLLGDGLLSALPNSEDELGDRYAVVREQVLSAFQEQALTPVAGRGGHRPSRSLVRSVSSLRAALSHEDVDVLREISVGTGGDRAAGWLPERPGRAGDFLDSLEAVAFGSADVAEVFVRVGELTEADARDDGAEDDADESDLIDLASWRAWVSGKDDAWLRSFYAALGRVPEQRVPFGRGDRRRYSWTDPFLSSLAVVPVVRTRLAGAVQHVAGPRAFLPASPGLEADGLVLDALAVFTEGENRSEKQDVLALRQFYEHAGVRGWDAAAQLEMRLSAYGPATTLDQSHLADLAELARLLSENAVSPAEYSRRAILLAGPDGALSWRAAAECYLDAPHGVSGLHALYAPGLLNSRYRLHPLAAEYAACGLDVADLARRLGARHALEITSADPRHGNLEFKPAWASNETHKKRSRDWTVLHFNALVGTDDETLLRALWHLVATAPADRADALYQANGSQPLHLMGSQLLRKLTTVPWVLDRYGNRNLPEDVTAADLDRALELPAHAPLLDRARFGRKAAAAAAVTAGADVAARTFGFASAADATRLGELCRRDPKLLDELVELARAAELQAPEAASEAPERRATRAAEAARGAPAPRYEKRVRSVYVSEPGHLSAARGYLRQLYTNDDGVLVCQVCVTAMPFTVCSEYYFEAVQFLRNAERDLQENRLALCPTCAAKYSHALDTPPEDLRDDLLTQDVGRQGHVYIDVALAGQPGRIRFVGKHAIDLQAALVTITVPPAGRTGSVSAADRPA